MRGEPPPPTAKVCINYEGGHRTTSTMLLTGLDIEEKAALLERGKYTGFQIEVFYNGLDGKIDGSECGDL